MATYTAQVNRFDGGMVSDPRDSRSGAARIITGFDPLSVPKKLSPYRQTESGDSSASTSRKQNFAIALRTGTTYSLYALGVQSGASTAEVLYKDISTGASNDLDDATWATPANNQSSIGATSMDLFTYYKKTGLIYGARAGTHIWTFSPTGSAWNDTERAISYTNIAEGLVHSKDDNLYIPYDNKIAKNDNGSWTNVAITLPSDLYITCLAEYGNYVAIGAAPLSSRGNSKVFLWDRDTSLETLSESYDAGEGMLNVLETVNNTLIAISLSGGDVIRLKDRISFKVLSSGGFVEIEELLADSGSLSLLPSMRQVINNRVHFQLKITLDGTVREGIWSIGPNKARTGFTIVHEQKPNNDTALTSGQPTGFIYVGDYLFQSYLSNSVYALSKTDDQANYATSIYESVINPGMKGEHKTEKKQIVGVRVMYEALPTAGQVDFYYRVDGGAWTQIFSETTDGVVVTEAKNDINKSNFSAGREYEFKVESSGGAEVTNLLYNYTVMKSEI